MNPNKEIPNNEGSTSALPDKILDESCAQQPIQPNDEIVNLRNITGVTSQTSIKIVPNSDNPKKRKSKEPLSIPTKKQTSSNRVQLSDFQKSEKTLFEQQDDNDINDIEMDQSYAITQTVTEVECNQLELPKHKPPPIVISGGSAEHIRRMANEINNQPGSFFINIKKDKQATKKVTAEHWRDYDSLIQKLKEEKYQFHTYPKKEEPQMKFVLYGLPILELDELERGLTAINVSPIKTAQMKMKQRRHADDQNYLLYFKGGSQKGEQEKFFRSLQSITIVCGYRVRWAKYENKRRGPTQCSKCLQFGHGGKGCNKTPNCFRCSEQHDSKDCMYIAKDSNRVPDMNLKCHFCGGNHTAISQKCSIRAQIVENWKERSANGNIRSQNQLKTKVPISNTASGNSVGRAPKAVKISAIVQNPVQQRAKTPGIQKNANTQQKQRSNQNKPDEIHNQKFLNNENLNKKFPSNEILNNKTNLKNKTKNLNNNKGKKNKQTLNRPLDSWFNLGNNKTKSIEKPSCSKNLETVKTTPNSNRVQNICQEETSADKPATRCLTLITQLLELITKNPECIVHLEKAIGMLAKTTTNQHES